MVKSIRVGPIKVTPKQRKKIFHLPISQTIFVPSTSGIKTQRRISKQELDRRVRGVRRFMSSRFGGFTSVRATGGFVLRGGKIVKEPITKVNAFATKDSFKKNKAQIIRQVGKYAKNWKQESVSYENEGDLFIISPPSRIRKIKRIKKVIKKSKKKKISKKRRK